MAGIVGLTELQHTNATSALSIDASGNLTIKTGTTTVKGEGTANTVLQKGLTKAWWHCQMYTPSLSSSFNTASLTDNSTGNFNIGLTSALSSSIRSSGACLSGSSINNRYIAFGGGTNNASSVNFLCLNDGAAAQDEDCKGQLTGDLA
jgi:hypothetical protein